MMEREVIPVWIDTDTGVDDALALAVAAALDRGGSIRVMGVSAVSGNVGLEKTFENARNVLSFLGREDIPVYPGADQPLVVKKVTAEFIHGENGLGGGKLPASKAPRETMKAWDALYECALRCGNRLQLVLIGPMTNAAIAFANHPDLADHIDRILVMGGAEVGGNITAAAEFNIYVDPHAAQRIFKIGLPVVMCGLDVTMRAVLTDEEIEKIVSSQSAAGRMYREISRMTRDRYRLYPQDGYAVHDVCPILYAVMPQLFTAETAGVFVETRGSITMGKTVCDRDTDVKFKDRHVTVVLDADRDAFAQTVVSLVTE